MKTGNPYGKFPVAKSSIEEKFPTPVPTDAKHTLTVPAVFPFMFVSMKAGNDTILEHRTGPPVRVKYRNLSKPQ